MWSSWGFYLLSCRWLTELSSAIRCCLCWLLLLCISPVYTCVSLCWKPWVAQSAVFDALAAPFQLCAHKEEEIWNYLTAAQELYQQLWQSQLLYFNTKAPSTYGQTSRRRIEFVWLLGHPRVMQRSCWDQVAGMPRKIPTSSASWMILCKASTPGRLPGEKLHSYITLEC